MVSESAHGKPKMKINLIFAVIGIIAIIASVGWYSLYMYSTNIDIDDSTKTMVNTNLINSGFGQIIVNEDSFNFKEEKPKIIENSLIYRNDTLGFEIARPNSTWSFQTNMSQIKIEQTGTITNKEFVGGVFVINPINENVFVSVFDISELDENSLIDYIDAQIQWITKNFDAKVKLKEISPNKHWGIFAAEVKQNNEALYGEQILEIRNDKLYMIQYTGIPPEKMQPEKLEEFKIIIGSFKILP